MKVAFFLLFLFFFKTSSSAGIKSACVLCSFITTPETWDDASQLIKMGCSRLGDAKTACNEIVDNADLTSSYPNMYPHIVELKNTLCAKLQMTFHQLLIIVKHLRSLLAHLIILSAATNIFVYFLIFGTENKKKLTTNSIALKERNNAQKPYQLAEYNAASRCFNINIAGNSIQFSASSGKFDMEDILKLKTVQIDPKLLINNSNFGPYNRLVLFNQEDADNKKKKPMEGYSMIVSLQENLLLRRMNQFASIQ